jgi:hypothetical protein
MAEAVNALSLVNLDDAADFIGATSDRRNVVIAELVKGVSARIEGALGRKVRSRTWTHDGTTLPRLNSRGGTKLWLPNVPVTSISTLKLDPDATALTQGWDEDFEVDADTGRIDLYSGSFLNRLRVVEITYAGGYLNDAAASAVQAYVYGYDDRSSDIRLACLQQIQFEYHRFLHQEEGILSRSEEGVSVQYVNTEFLPSVQGVIDRYRFDPPLTVGT